MKQRLSRMLAWVAALALVAAPIVAVLNGWLADGRWPIREIEISSQFKRLEESAIQAAMAPKARLGFFAVDLEALRLDVEALPWVERAEVRKVWPDKLEVLVQERVPIAHWGEDRLLGSNGELFKADYSAFPDPLPLLDGVDTRADEVWREHQAAKTQLAEIGLELGQTRLNPRGAWTLITGNGAEIVLGRENIRSRLARFVQAMKRLPESEHQRVLRADLRFANGFAVVWRAVEPAPSSPAIPPASTSEEAHEPQV